MIIKMLSIFCDSPSCKKQHNKQRRGLIKAVENQLKHEGWTIITRAKQKIHYCPDCSKLLEENDES